MADYMVTTFDNVYNPFTHFKEWYQRDLDLGYNTCQWLANFVKTSIELPEELMNQDIDHGIDDFLAFNPFGMHYKVYKDEANTLIPLMYEEYQKSKPNDDDAPA